MDRSCGDEHKLVSLLVWVWCRRGEGKHPGKIRSVEVWLEVMDGLLLKS